MSKTITTAINSLILNTAENGLSVIELKKGLLLEKNINTTNLSSQINASLKNLVESGLIEKRDRTYYSLTCPKQPKIREIKKPASIRKNSAGKPIKRKLESKNTASARDRPKRARESVDRTRSVDKTVLKRLIKVYGEERYEMVLSEILESDPDVTWDSISGLENAKAILKETIMLPTVVPAYFVGIRRPWRGVLLTGPPGTGKTLLARAIANECSSTFFNIACSSIVSKYLGESEKLIRLLFELARLYAPSVIFFDEVDSLCSARGQESEHEASRRLKSEILLQIENRKNTEDPEKSVAVVAASNYPWDLDEALLRRLEKRLYLPLPDVPAIEALLVLKLQDLELDGNVDFKEIAKLLINYSAADVTNLCRTAAMIKMRERIKGLSSEELRNLTIDDLESPVSKEDFKEAIRRVKKSVNLDDIPRYQQWIQDFGSA